MDRVDLDQRTTAPPAPPTPADGPNAPCDHRPDGVGDTRRALGAFLRTRRERVAPEQIGLAGGGRRRVRGLRREELAQHAGISVDYYIRLEQGRATQPSPEVLGALADALGLDAAERRHLATLADTRRTRPPLPRTAAGPSLRRVLDALGALPAYVTDHRLDIVACNPLGAALLGGPVPPAPYDPARPHPRTEAARDPNQARFLFLDPAARQVFPDWQALATETAGQLRVSAGRFPDDRELTWLIGELSAHSEEFRRIWATGEVVMCDSGRRRLHHPATGTLHLDYDTLHIPAAPGETGLVMHVLSAEHGTPEEAALTRLAAQQPPQAAPGS